MSIFSRGFSIVCVTMTVLSATSLHAANSITSASALSREATPVIRSLPTPTAKAWASARIKLYADTLKSTQKSYSTDASSYRKEVGIDAVKFLNALRDGKYTYSLTETEKKDTEAVILSYQKEMVSAMRQYITQVKTHDSRETGNMNVSFHSGDMNIEFALDPYTVTQTRDMKNIEVKGGINLSVSGSDLDEGAIKLSIRGAVLLADRDLYITLENYTLSSDVSTDMIKKVQKALEKIKGKTYHQELEQDISAELHDSQKAIESAEKVLKKLETSSLLTPVAREGSSYILMFRKATILDLARLTKTSSITDVQLRNLLIPVDLRLDGTTVKIAGYTPGLQISGTLSRDTTGTTLLTLDGRERATYDPWTWQLSRTAGYWAFAMSSDEYTVSAKAGKTSAEATVKEGDKTIVTARIDETGLNAWTYNIQAIWDNLTYDWENDTTKTETMTLKIWGALKREFGNFTLTPPTLYEEMSRLEKELESLSE